MELWEVLDGEGNPTGEIMEKYDKKVFERGLYHLGSDIWIINSDNKILIQKRSPLKRLEPKCMGYDWWLSYIRREFFKDYC